MKSTKLPILLTILSGVLFFGCYAGKIPLTSEEKKFGKDLASKYQCEVVLQHDYNAVKDNRKDGNFIIAIEEPLSDLCSKDSTSLKVLASEIVRNFLPSLSYRNNYQSVELLIRRTLKIDGQPSKTICDKSLIVSTKNLTTIISF